MAVDLSALDGAHRLLITAQLKPLQGTRFQPTGFPDLGAATYQAPSGAQMLLVESAQSVANRLEGVCWDEATEALSAPLAGLPYIRVVDGEGKLFTASVLESHRINSPYILEANNKQLLKTLGEELGAEKSVGRVSYADLATLLLKYDPNSLLHGVFLARKEIAGGRVRLPRALSGFVEASDVQIAASGGLKRDDVDPSGDTKTGKGHVPFHRDEYTGNITAYFNLDLAQLRAYRLGDAATTLLTGLALYKIRHFLDHGLRLRTACDLEVVEGGLSVDRPAGFELPSAAALDAAMPEWIEAASSGFASPRVTTLQHG